MSFGDPCSLSSDHKGDDAAERDVTIVEFPPAGEADELASSVADGVADAMMTSVVAEDRNPEALNWRGEEATAEGPPMQLRICSQPASAGSVDR
jgi:hypothetical protein